MKPIAAEMLKSNPVTYSADNAAAIAKTEGQARANRLSRNELNSP